MSYQNLALVGWLVTLVMMPGVSEAFQTSTRSVPTGRQVAWKTPAESEREVELKAAAKWLEKCVHRGVFHPADDAKPLLKSDMPLAVIAWRDPTLGKDGTLVGYLQTDSLWSAYALQAMGSPAAKDLFQSLDLWHGRENRLQEVLFQPVKELGHRVMDKDFVHGTPLGILETASGQKVDIRAFHFQADEAFRAGHTRLFAEHLAYQAIDDFWNGETESARDRLRQLMREPSLITAQQPIGWDFKRQLLLDHGNWEAWKDAQPKAVPQFPIKLGTVLYALRLTGVCDEYPEQTRAIQRRLWQAQWPKASEDSPPGTHDPESAGGFAHFMLVHPDGRLVRGKGATGEATSIGILSTLVVAAER